MKHPLNEPQTTSKVQTTFDSQASLYANNKQDL